MAAFIAATARGDIPTGSIEYETIFVVGFTLFLMTLILNAISIRLRPQVPAGVRMTGAADRRARAAHSRRVIPRASGDGTRVSTSVFRALLLVARRSSAFLALAALLYDVAARRRCRSSRGTSSRTSRRGSSRRTPASSRR